MKYSEKVAVAIEFARELHAGQTRKGTTEPYINHLVGTVEIATRFGANEMEQVAAVLHDALEDHPRGGETELRIKMKFGGKVLSVVKECTNTYGNKLAYAAHLRAVTKGAALVAASDKLYNATSILTSYAEVGAAVFERFKAPRVEVLAYYRAVANALATRAPVGLAAELEAAVSKMEAL
jgi:(p)ppGpp synthase/HD superfamily hydrolase